MDGSAAANTGGARLFGGLARWIVRHPWYPIAFWLALLVVALPFLGLVGSVTTNSASTAPTSAPSSQAAAELARLFPNQTGGASSTILLVGPNMTDANAQGVVLNVTAALEADRSLVDLASVATVYSEYTGYLSGQAQLALGVVQSGLASVPSVPVAVNSSASLWWAPQALYVGVWQGLVANGTAPASANYPAYERAEAVLANETSALTVLAAFYNGNSSAPGFNSTHGCWTSPADVVSCSDATARATEVGLVPTLVPVPDERAVPYAVLATLGLENSTAWASVRSTASVVLGEESGLAGSWIFEVWTEFPSARASPAATAAWAAGVVAGATLADEPLPVPRGIYTQYVSPSGQGQVVQLGFTEPDDFTNATGGQPVYADLGRIDNLVPGVVRASDPTHSIAYYQTGPAPLDLLTQTAVNASLELVLPLTVGLLLVISMLYFRSPMTPMVTFGILGIALVLGIGGTVMIGELIEHVDSTALTLEEVFVLGVGTDYSIFMVARYREELVRGKSSEDAIVASLAWAGQSVATSGSTAIIATLALTFSGVALLAQWGAVLSLAILITLLVSLTMVPACLRLLGPRIFWPTTGERFRRRAAVVAERNAKESTYFYRVGRGTQRRPGLTVGIILLVSIPLLVLAFQVPLSYDYYAQLPSGHPATNGLNELGNQFGPGFAVPSFALVTFAAPLLEGNSTNATEFTDVAALTTLATGTSGIASVSSPVGPDGASLSQWLSLATLPSATRTNLIGVLSGFVGSDGRTVLLSIVPNSTGLSVNAVNAVSSLEGSFRGYQGSHAEISSLAFGGGAPTINDLATETNTATEYLIAAVSIGLVLVLLIVLRSWIIALMAIATIGVSIGWAWAITYLVFQGVLGFPLFFYVRTILFILILGLGIDYNIFLLSRVREERLRGRSSSEAAVQAVARTGGIITAAAIILAAAFAALIVGEFTLIRAIGFSVAIAVILDAMVVRTYLVPASLQLLGDRVWHLSGRKPRADPAEPAPPADGSVPAAATVPEAGS
ncbi:MAG TPA: MMPL family transporter [Thermoplasmata archaeon]|nr:MMPL family transporter [Thermoplasmata archaeon]